MKETNGLFTDKIWCLKSYKKHFESFQYDVYWEILNVLKDEKVFVLGKEIFERMYYWVLPFRVWSHMWCCCRLQYDPDICQFCTKLQIKDKKVHRFISKKFFIDSRKLFPDDLFFIVTYKSEIPLFVHVNFGPDR